MCSGFRLSLSRKDALAIAADARVRLIGFEVGKVPDEFAHKETELMEHIESAKVSGEDLFLVVFRPNE